MSGKSIKIRYFAWLRERIGKAEETITLPQGVATAAQLISWLSATDEGYAYAFEEPDTIRIALDQEHAEADAALADISEVAFFPPMTGG